MKDITEINNDLDKATLEKVSPFKPRLAFSSGSSGDETDWLSPLEIRTVFLARHRQTDPKVPYALTEFHVTGKSLRSTRIMTVPVVVDPQNVMGQRVELWVDPQSFSLNHRLFEVLVDGKELRELQEEDDRRSNRTAQQD